MPVDTGSYLSVVDKGRVKKKVWKIPHFGGWVGQEWDNIHKKHDFKIHFRPF